jgi:murein DD-endopeptidase MepM/ murein hydrolase activator NlpD
MATNSDYINMYKGYAVEQMRKYGIPASVTLAQGILESANGQSQLARSENNHFGMKASKAWIEGGGGYGLYTDDAKDEKFCSYASVGDSYEHHSQVLAGSKRYAACFALPADDYVGWAKGLQSAGYASDSHYADSLIKVIERNGLEKIDEEVLNGCYATRVKSEELRVKNEVDASNASAEYSFPLKRQEFLFVTSPFGMRTDPTDSSKQQMHRGIDIRADHEAVMATESGGRVVAVCQDAATAGGRSVTLEFDREDGCKVRTTYCHLESVGVKVGDSVKAGQQIGISGNTGTHTTGPHLHFGVKQVNADGSTRDVDPAAYLEEIAQRGNLKLTAMYDGQDLLAKYRSSDVAEGVGSALAEGQMSPEEWIRKLLSSEDSGIGLGSSDSLMDILVSAFSSLMALALSLDNNGKEVKMAAATDAAANRRINLSSLIPGLKQCELTVDGSKAKLTASDGNGTISHSLSSAEMNRLSLTLADEGLTEEQKRQRLTALIGNMLTAERASKIYNENINTNLSQSENIQIR